MNVNIYELDSEIAKILQEYNAEVIAGVKKTTTKAMKNLVTETKSTAPVGRREKHYRDSITSKTLTDTMFGLSLLWYVKGSDYRLSHLLNDGHALRDGGRYPGTNFIGNAVDRILPLYLADIEEAIRNG